MDKTTTKMWRKKLEVIEQRSREIKEAVATVEGTDPPSAVRKALDDIFDYVGDIDTELFGLGNQIERSVDRLIDRLDAPKSDGPTLTMRFVIEGAAVKSIEVQYGQETGTRD